MADQLVPALAMPGENGHVPEGPPPAVELPAVLTQQLLEAAAQTPVGRALLDGYLLGRGVAQARCRLVAGPCQLVFLDD